MINDMEQRNVKLNAEVYIFIGDESGASIVKARVSGCREINLPFAKYLFTLETPCGRYERAAADMYEDVQEIKDNLESLIAG